MDSKRRTLLTTGAAAVAAATAPRAFAQAFGNGADTAAAKPFYERGNVRIYYQDVGAGFPLLLIPGRVRRDEREGRGVEQVDAVAEVVGLS